MEGLSISFETLTKPQRWMVKLAGAIDMKTATELENAVNRHITSERERFIFDFASLDYINSQGLGVLLQLQRQLNPKGGGVIVVGMIDRVKKVFLTTGVNKVVPIYATADDALAQDELFRGK